MKNELYKNMYEEYQNGYSLSEVGRMFGMTRQSVYSGFACRGYKFREKKKLPFVMFDGKKWTLRNTGYYAMTDGKRGLLHVYKWEYYNGKTPPGYDIHHKDFDKTNNDIDNLQLLTKSEHSKLHALIRKNELNK